MFIDYLYIYDGKVKSDHGYPQGTDYLAVKVFRRALTGRFRKGGFSNSYCDDSKSENDGWCEGDRRESRAE